MSRYRYAAIALLVVLITAQNGQAAWLGKLNKRHHRPALGLLTLLGGRLSARRDASPVQLVSRTKQRRLRDMMPQVNNPKIQQLLNDPELIFYTNEEMPPAYQSWSGSLQGVHSPSYNISAGGSEPFGNGNREFPWSAPAGTHRTRNVSPFRFLRLPRNEEGKLLPIVWQRRHLRGSNSRGYTWRYPVGTVFGEVLMMRAPSGTRYTFELRLRFRRQARWAVNVFRPFPTAEHLAKRIRQLRPNWQQQPQLARLVRHLEEPIKLVRQTLADNHPVRSFKQTIGVDNLPPVGDDLLVQELLTGTTFVSALGATWREGTGGNVSSAPTTDAAFHIVPAKYDAGFVEVDHISCIRCHQTVNQSVTRFDFGRDWYGRIRGSDGIFSFHPFDPSCISYNGFSLTTRLRTSLVNAGVLAKYDENRHSSAVYREIKFLKP